MEKRGIIRPDITPPENNTKPDEKIANTADQTARIVALDQDFRLRAAETVVKTKKS